MNSYKNALANLQIYIYIFVNSSLLCFGKIILTIMFATRQEKKNNCLLKYTEKCQENILGLSNFMVIV